MAQKTTKPNSKFGQTGATSKTKNKNPLEDECYNSDQEINNTKNTSVKKTTKSQLANQKSSISKETNEKITEKKPMVDDSDSEDTGDNQRLFISQGQAVDVKMEDIDEERNQEQEMENSQNKQIVNRVTSKKGMGSEQSQMEEEDEEEQQQQQQDEEEEEKEQNIKEIDEGKKVMKKGAKKNKNKNQKGSKMEIEDEQKVKKNRRKKKDETEEESQENQEEDDELMLKNSELIDVQKEQGKKNLEEQYELPYYLTKEFIKDAQGRSPSDPHYDSSTVFIPVQELKKEKRVFQQYWRTKSKNYDKVVFFRFGRVFMCFFNDALLMKRLFDCQVSTWGKRPITNIFDNSFKFYVKELLEKAQKSCVVVDQIEHSEEKANEQDIIKREITQIITKGTYTDYIDNSEDYNARYLMCVVESETDHSFGIAMVDCTTHQIFMDDIKNDPAGNQIRTILRKMKPVEVYSVFNNLSDSTKNICRTTCKPQFTYDKKFEFQELPTIFEEIKNEYREKIPIVKSSKSKSQSDAKNSKKVNNIKQKKMLDDEEGQRDLAENEDISDDSSDDEGDNDDNFDLQKEIKEVPKFTYGELSKDYPVLLKDIEEMYLQDKQKFDENFRLELMKKKKNSKKNQPKEEEENEDEEDDEPNFDIEFQYYMMLQAVMLMLSYLRELKLNENVFRMGSYQLLDTNIQKNTYLHLDAHAIENLDIFEANIEGNNPQDGSLMNFIDFTSSAFGKRMLKRWLTYPLKNKNQIEQRQEAIEDLMKITAVIDEFDKKLNKFGDIERQISKVFNSTQKSRLKHSSFENFSNARLKEAYVLVKDLKELAAMIAVFDEEKNNFKSNRLKRLTTVKDLTQFNKMIESTKAAQAQTYIGQKTMNKQQNKPQQQNLLIGMFPDLRDFLSQVDNQLEEDENGQCQPKEGADPLYDEVVLRIEKIYRDMKLEASVWKKKLGSEEVKLVKNKGQWEVQVPEKLVEGNKKPKNLHLTSRIKNYSRFQSDILMGLCNKLKREELHLSKALAPFCERIFFSFFKNRDLLYQAVNCVGELDCLCSLAKCAIKLPIKCKPTFVADPQVFELREMYHPQLLKEGKCQLVPNDTVFSKGALCLLVTGPNMGGKSTLLRQTCLAVILAQIGSYIPADSFKTAIRDRIFCRIGASDRLLEGKSTFLVEMEETGDIVKEATSDSIVLLDELGRGTSTFDGVSIAYGVLRYLVDDVKCLTLFSTHYHILIDEFKLYKTIHNYLMDYYYDEKQLKIIFKYKFIQGSTEKSFGINVAKMAGIPPSVLAIAEEKEQAINDESRDITTIRGLTKLFNALIQQCIGETPENGSGQKNKNKSIMSQKQQ